MYDEETDFDLSEVTQTEICDTFALWCKDKKVNDMWNAFVLGMGLSMIFSFGNAVKHGNA